MQRYCKKIIQNVPFCITDISLHIQPSNLVTFIRVNVKRKLN